jgi:hypothetical protein
VKVSGTLGLGTLPPVTTALAPKTIPAASSSKPADSITFSSEARLRAQAAAHPRWGALSAKVHADPEVAEQVAYELAHFAQQELLDITEWMTGKGPIRYSATGEPYTPESRARFAAMAENFRAAGVALYERELAKGTDFADIFDKLVALGDTQPAEFRAMAHWDASFA